VTTAECKGGPSWCDTDFDDEIAQADERWTGVELCPATDLTLRLAGFRVDYAIRLVRRDPCDNITGESVVVLWSARTTGDITHRGCSVHPASANAFAVEESAGTMIYQCGDTGIGILLEREEAPFEPAVSDTGHLTVVSVYATDKATSLFNVMTTTCTSIVDGPVTRSIERCGTGCRLIAASLSVFSDVVHWILVLLFRTLIV